MKPFLQRSASSLIAIGVLSIILGILCLVFPFSAAYVMVIFWGVFVIVDSIFMIQAAVVTHGGSRAYFIIMAIIGFIAGIMALVWPAISEVALTWAVGVWLIFRGIMDFVSLFSAEATGMRWSLGLSAVLFIILGVIFVATPVTSVLSLTWAIGLLAAFWGGFTIYSGIAAKRALKNS